MTRLTFSIIVASTLSLAALVPADASAQTRAHPNNKKQTVTTVTPVQIYPQVRNSSVQQTLNNAYMGEMYERNAFPVGISPYLMMQPYGYSYGMYGYNP